MLHFFDENNIRGFSLNFRKVSANILCKIAVATSCTSGLWRVHLTATLQRAFSDINISQGSVATRLIWWDLLRSFSCKLFIKRTAGSLFNVV